MEQMKYINNKDQASFQKLKKACKIEDYIDPFNDTLDSFQMEKEENQDKSVNELRKFNNLNKANRIDHTFPNEQSEDLLDFLHLEENENLEKLENKQKKEKLDVNQNSIKSKLNKLKKASKIEEDVELSEDLLSLRAFDNENFQESPYEKREIFEFYNPFSQLQRSNKINNTLNEELAIIEDNNKEKEKEKEKEKSNESISFNKKSPKRSKSPKSKKQLKEEYILILPNQAEEFPKDFLHEINKGRYNCRKYSLSLDRFFKNIKIEQEKPTKEFPKKKKYYFLFNEKKIYIKLDKPITEYSKYLKNLHIDMEKEYKLLRQITYKEELKVPFPKDISKWNDKNYLKNSRINLLRKIKGKFNLLEFHFMKCVNNPEISAIVNMINYLNNENTCIILNQKVEFLGINHYPLDEDFCLVYLVFANSVK